MATAGRGAVHPKDANHLIGRDPLIAEERRPSHICRGRNVFSREPPPEALDAERKPKPAFNRG
jgi:hypothetical protein